MTKIKLYGELGKIYGQEHNLSLDRLSEFGVAMEANFRGFKKFFIDSVNEAKAYCLFVDGNLIAGRMDLQNILNKRPSEIAVVPIISGAAYIIPYIAAYLVEYGIAYAVTETVLQLVLMAVVSAVVSTLFAPKPKSAIQTSTANAGLSSYYFGGRANKAQQGQPVPIVYGQLKIGSYVIQAGIRNLDKDDFANLNNGDGGGEPPTGTFI